LAVVTDDASNQLEQALNKWFVKAFISGAKLALLRSLYKSGAFGAFSQLLSDFQNKDYVTILAKVDKHCLEIQMKSREEMLRHLERLASGDIEPAKALPKPKGKGNTRKQTGGIIGSSNY
jgi:hypothetical protein